MPAKNQFLSKLREDQEVRDTFLLLQKQLASGKTGRNYLRLTLGDRSGQMGRTCGRGPNNSPRASNPAT